MLRLLAVLVGLVIVVAAAFILLPALMRDSDSPLARMYRTEADLASLANAVDAYRAANGTYPPPGAAGLAAALTHISQHADYFPGGPPMDGWGRPFCYVPHSDYESPGSRALKDDGFFAPDSYQLYSAGMDSVDGVDDVNARADNITSWDSDRPWRGVYKSLDES